MYTVEFNACLRARGEFNKGYQTERIFKLEWHAIWNGWDLWWEAHM